MNAKTEAFVVAVIATYRRPLELQRLLTSLAAVQPRTPLAVMVVDNADDAATAGVVCEVSQAAPALEVSRLLPGANLGCGGGLAYGEQAALERYADRLTHLWLLDDDTEAAPDSLERLLAALEAEAAALACPMIVDGDGAIGWFPGLLDHRAFDAVRTLRTPAEYIAHCGTKPIRFSWATGVSLLVTREAIEQLGPHRDDFWIRGEDLDFSLRITAHLPGIYVPGAIVAHLPPAGADSPEARAAERRKHAIMLQNIAFITLRLPYGRPILRNVPGNLWRFVKTWGAASLPEALRALWVGGVLGRPGGYGL